MDTYTDALYEMEFQRMFRLQGIILTRIAKLNKQNELYRDKLFSLQDNGRITQYVEERIKTTNERLRYFTSLRDTIEDYKDEISVNNPENFHRVETNSIIYDAYEQAYMPEPKPITQKKSNFQKICANFISSKVR